MEMDTGVHVTRGMMREQEAVALGDQLDTRTIGAFRAQSGDRKYPDRNSLAHGTSPQASMALANFGQACPRQAPAPNWQGCPWVDLKMICNLGDLQVQYVGL